MKKRLFILSLILLNLSISSIWGQDCLIKQEKPSKILACISYQFDSIKDYNYDFKLVKNRLSKASIQFLNEKNNDSYVKSITYLGLIHEQQGELDQANEYFNQAEQNIQLNNLQTLEFWVQTKKVGLYRKTGDYSTAIFRLESIQAKPLKLNNRDNAQLNTTLGYYYQTIGKSDKSISHFFTALNYAKNIKDKRLKAIIYNNLGNSYAMAGNFQTAEEYFQNGINVFGEESKVEIPILFNNIAEVNQEQGNQEEALNYYYKAYQYTSPQAYEQITEITINISQIYLEKENSDSALTYLNIAQVNSKKFGVNSLERAHALYMQSVYNKAIYGNKRAQAPLTEAYKISAELNLTAELVNYSLDLSNLFHTLNNLDSAHYYLLKHIEYKSILLNQSSKEQLIRKTEEFKLDSIQAQSILIRKEKNYLELQVSKRNSVITLVSCLLGSLLLAGYFFWRSLHRKKQLLNIELENKKLIIENKNKELIGANLELDSKTKALNNLNDRIKLKLSQEYDPQFNELSQIVREGSRIMSDQERKKYINSLIQLENSFYQRLKEFNQNLTDDEFKLAALIRLNLSNDELIDIFNITRSSLNTKRYRLRKKLSLESETNLDQFIRKL